jgi:Zn-dependent oligopeptidase
MNGYEGGYYGYLWAQVRADDLYATLAPGGVPDPRAGRRFRDDILAPARSRDPDAEMRAFLGRPADPRAFYRALGLEPKSLPAAIR